MALISGLMAGATKVHGPTTICMGREHSLGLMVDDL